MKAFALVAMLLVSSVSFADENSGSAEVLRAQGFITTVVGGCAGVKVIGSGENTEIIYTEPCQVAPTHPQRYTKSVYGVVFSSYEEAQLHCNRKDEVTGAYTMEGLVGYVCRELNDTQSGN